MLRGYRSAIIKIAGLVTVSLLATGLFLSLSRQSTELEKEASDRSNVYQKNANDRIIRVCPTAISQVDCIAETNEAAREGQRKEQDLSAQKVTAWWTNVMGIAALIGMALSAVGVWLVKTTFDETRKANVIAVKAEDASLIFNFPNGLQDPVGDFLFDMTIANVGRSAAIIHEIEICGERVLMERTIKAGETDFLGKFAIVPATADKNLFMGVRYSTPFKSQETLTEIFSVLPPRGERKTWWAISFKFKNTE